GALATLSTVLSQWRQQLQCQGRARGPGHRNVVLPRPTHKLAAVAAPRTELLAAASLVTAVACRLCKSSNSQSYILRKCKRERTDKKSNLIDRFCADAGGGA